MVQTNPIAGNQFFRNVENSSGQLSSLTAAEVNMGDANVSGLKAKKVASSILVQVPADKTLVKVQLQTNTSDTNWRTAGSARNLVLKGTTTPFQFEAESTVVASELKVTTAFVEAETGAKFDIGVTTNNGTASNVLGGALVADLNAVGSMVTNSNAAGSALGEAPVSAVIASANAFVTCSANAQSWTDGAADVNIFYYVN